MEIRGSGDLFGYKQSGGSGSVGYELYARLVQGAIHKSVDSSPGEWIRPEEVDVRFFSKRFIPEEYINSEEIRLSIYKSLSLAFDRDSLDELTYSLINRFGALPLPVKSLINESRLRAGLSRAGILSVIRRGCGVVCNLGVDNGGAYGPAILEYVSSFWEDANISSHILPVKGSLFSICIHLGDNEDSYSLFSGFVDKFTTYEKAN
jgi:transcription-repair coupling factor (superfamily II helicase)